MANRFASKRLSDVAKVYSGYAFKGTDFSSSGIPVIKIKNIRDRRVTTEGSQYFPPALITSKHSRFFLSNKDVLIAMTGQGSVGRVGRLLLGDGERALLNQRVGKFTADANKLDLGYLYYVLTTSDYNSRLFYLGSGSGQPNLSPDAILSIDIPLPPLSLQKSIAHILGSLDDKIELNRKMNETLEAMAQAIFKSWFVDFDPVKAKAEGRQPFGMDADTAALFPDSFEDSELGPIPKGWKVGAFSNHVTVSRGLSYKGVGLCNAGSGLPMHNLNSVHEGGGYKRKGIKYYQGEFKDKHLVQPGDLIVINTEQGFDRLLIGHAAIVPECFGDKGLFSHHVFRVRSNPESDFTPNYLVYLINSRRWHDWISGFSNGTTINMLPVDALSMPLLVVPPRDLIRRFTMISESHFERIELGILESSTLAALRDTLLPKLLSGELSANDLESALS